MGRVELGELAQGHYDDDDALIGSGKGTTLLLEHADTDGGDGQPMVHNTMSW
jgi:hypothetical protein